jgi:DNA repair exonuclease SbcCD ATPase subunit
MLSVKSLEISGFMNIEAIETVRLDANGLTLIVGENGSGKSSRYTEALYWGLYGKTIRDLPADGIINLKSDMAQVEVILHEPVSKTTYRIIREKSKGSAQVLDIVCGEVGGACTDMFPASSVLAKQDMLEEWLGLDAKTFLNSIVFGQGAAALFASGALSDSERKKVFDQICGFDEFDKAQKVAAAERRVLDVELATHFTRLTDARGALSTMSNEIAAFEERVKQLARDSEVQVERLAKDIENAEEDLVDAKEALEEAETDLQLALDAKTAHDAEVATLPSLIESRDEALVISMDAKASIANFADVLSRSKVMLESVHAQDKKLQKSLDGGVCPYCGSKTIDMEQVKSDIKECGIDILKWKRSIDNAQHRVSELTPEREEAVSFIEEANRQISSIQGRRMQISEMLSVKKSLVSAFKATVDAKERALAALGDSVNALDSRGEENLRGKELKQKALEEKEKQTKELATTYDEIKTKQDVIAFWEEAFGPKGIKAYIIEGMLPNLNRLLNEHLANLTDGSITAEVAATTALKKGGEAERLSVTVRNARGAALYGGNSGGERRRIDLAILLALQDLVGMRAKKALNLSIYDEVLDALDTDGITRAVSYLTLRAKDRPTYLISHSDDARALVESTVELK